MTRRDSSEAGNNYGRRGLFPRIRRATIAAARLGIASRGLKRTAIDA
jgi:hypothetical protein